jgi:hypothetical protein
MTAPPSPREHPIMDRADTRGEVTVVDAHGRLAGPRGRAGLVGRA